MTAWTGERIAELRGLAEQAYKPEVGAAVPLKDALTPDAVLSLLDELESYHDALDDVMGALSQALDGDDMYNVRPAEVVWRLRDQRDEAQEAERSKNAEYLLASEQVAECAAELEGCKLERSELLAQLTDYAEGLESTRAALTEAVTTIHELRAEWLK